MALTPRYRHLNEQERLQICQFIRSHVPLTRNKDHAFRQFARWQVSLLLWRWTADAYCTRQKVIRPDAIKYDLQMLPATHSARESRRIAKKGLRHEHTVPRMVLAKRIIENDLTMEKIYELLIRHCRAVVVTKEEDQLLSKHGLKSMPAGGEWETGCPYAPLRGGRTARCHRLAGCSTRLPGERGLPTNLDDDPLRFEGIERVVHQALGRLKVEIPFDRQPEGSTGPAQVI